VDLNVNYQINSLNPDLSISNLNAGNGNENISANFNNLERDLED